MSGGEYKDYLGDGVYVAVDCGMIRPALVRWEARVREEMAHARK